MIEYIRTIIDIALASLGYTIKEYKIDKPKNESFGDFSVNAAMSLASELKENPRNIAAGIIGRLEYDNTKISKITVAGAGFINFFISDDYYKSVLIKILEEKDNYGRSCLNEGKTANLEWVSANPTGLLHAGHGRQVCLGKAIANLLEWSGYEVTREYYYNDAGNQMNMLSKSVCARYMQLITPDFPFPPDGYHGEYIKEIAKIIFNNKGDALKDKEDDILFRETAEQYNFGRIKETLGKFNIKHDVFFNETSLYSQGDLKVLLEKFRENNLSYEKEGAVWLKMEDEGFEKDKVIVKSTGEPTYRLPDIAYHINKIKRGFDFIVDIFGSDHGDTYKEVLFGIRAAGYSTENIKVIIHQMVTFKTAAESVKMSKRSDKVYLLDDLISDAGIDATQFFFVMRAPGTQLDFDIDLAREQSDKNPVYYLQYAHARICGILRNAGEIISPEKICAPDFRYELINNSDEIDLLKILSLFPHEISEASYALEPHRIINYLNRTAEAFHKFYHNNRVIDAGNSELSKARLYLCYAAKQVLKNGFDVIGISAPERM